MSETLFGKYRLLAELGRGGMADVYLAASTGLGGFQKLVVIKVSRVSDDPAFSQMFLDEARLSARLSHVNVVQTYEVGEENGRQYIVMEYLEGPSLFRLNRLAAPSGGVPLRLMVQILANVLGGLQYAHTLKDFDGTLLNVVHRDLSPQNLMVTTQGACKLLDFGIAKTADSRTQTHAGFYRGKINYMAPEQALGNAVDARADVFSVGVLLAEAITRKSFWGDATTAVISSRLVTGDIPDIEQAHVEPILEEICKAALAPDRAHRTASAQDFKNALDWYLGTRGGPVGAEELAAFVAPLVADDRTRVNALIDQQLKQGAAPVPFNLPLPQAKTPAASAFASVTGPSNIPSATRGSGYTPIAATLAAADVAPARAQAPVPVPARSATADSYDGLSIDVAGTSSPSLPKIDRGVRSAQRKPDGKDSTTRLVIGLVAAGFVVLVGLVVWLAGRATVPTRPVVETVPVIEPVLTPVIAPAPRPVLVELSVAPPEATLELDGVKVTNPYSTAAADGKVHRLTAHAEGFEPLSREVSFLRDVTMALQLRPLAALTVVEPPRPVIEAPRVAVVAHRAPPKPTPPPARPGAAKSEPVGADNTAIQEMTPKAKPAAGKRSIDTEVFDETRKELDRNNPWEN